MQLYAAALSCYDNSNRNTQRAPAGGASTADAVNRWLTGALMVVFGGILAFGAGHADASLLAATVDWWAAPPAIPIIFLSLVRPG